jgi:hypothetical protein
MEIANVLQKREKRGMELISGERKCDSDVSHEDEEEDAHIRKRTFWKLSIRGKI